MGTIDRENKYAKLNVINGFLVTGVKHWFLKLTYNYSYIIGAPYYIDIEKIDNKMPVSSVKKMGIASMSVLAIFIFILAAMSFGFGFLRGEDQDTGQIGPPHILTGTIIAVILAALGFLYLKSNFGRLKILQSGRVFIYASLDKEELKSLKELIINYQQGIIDQPVSSHLPPPLPPLHP